MLYVDRADDVAGDMQITAPTLVLYGASGSMTRLYDIPGVWAERCHNLRSASVTGGHFFPDSSPGEVVDHVSTFLRDFSFKSDEDR